MKKIAILLVSLLTAFSGFSPAGAFPTVTMSSPQTLRPIENVQWDSDRRWRPQGQKWRGNFRERHYRDRYHDRRAWRHHDRRHHNRSNAAAVIGGLAAGAIIGGAIAQSQQPRYSAQRSYTGDTGHVNWCFNRYRSYRAYDNTFQPYNGPRQLCYSPY